MIINVLTIFDNVKLCILKTIILNYKHNGYKGQYFTNGSLYEAMNDLKNMIGQNTGSGSLKQSSGICGKFNFNFILN